MRKKENKVSLTILRQAKGLSQRDLAKATGISPSTIASYETGTRMPRLDNALILSEFFGIKPQQIQFGPPTR